MPDMGSPVTLATEDLIRVLRALTDIQPQDIPALLIEVERVRTVLWLKISTARHGPDQRAHVPTADVMTVAEVAEKLRFSRAHIYELIRSGDLAALRDGRHVRIPAGSLGDWERRHQNRPVDPGLSVSLSSGRDRPRRETHPQKAGTHPAPVRGARGRARGDRGEVGDGRSGDPRSSREAHEATGRRAAGQTKPSSAAKSAGAHQA